MRTRFGRSFGPQWRDELLAKARRHAVPAAVQLAFQHLGRQDRRRSRPACLVKTLRSLTRSKPLQLHVFWGLKVWVTELAHPAVYVGPPARILYKNKPKSSGSLADSRPSSCWRPQQRLRGGTGVAGGGRVEPFSWGSRIPTTPSLPPQLYSRCFSGPPMPHASALLTANSSPAELPAYHQYCWGDVTRCAAAACRSAPLVSITLGKAPGAS
jgi:hypothetical protein